MSLLLFASVSQLTSFASAAPFNITGSTLSLNDIPLTSPQCQDIDNCRSLYSIISSCVGTLFICVFVAVHRDVDSPHGRWARTVDFAGSILWTLIAPEYGLARAIDQFLDAGILSKRLEAARLGLGDDVHSGRMRDARTIYHSEETRKLVYSEGSSMDGEVVYTAIAGAAWKMSRSKPKFHRREFSLLALLHDLILSSQLGPALMLSLFSRKDFGILTKMTNRSALLQPMTC